MNENQIKSKSKVKFRWTSDLMRELVKHLIKCVENEWSKNNWKSTSNNVSGVQHTTRVFLICAGAWESVFMPFSCEPGSGFSKPSVSTGGGVWKLFFSKALYKAELLRTLLPFVHQYWPKSTLVKQYFASQIAS